MMQLHGCVAEANSLFALTKYISSQHADGTAACLCKPLQSLTEALFMPSCLLRGRHHFISTTLLLQQPINHTTHLSILDCCVESLHLEPLCVWPLQEGEAVAPHHLISSPAAQLLPGVVGKNHLVGVAALCDDARLSDD